MTSEDIMLDKHLQVKEFGDSLYIPLTRFFRLIKVNRNDVVRVVLYSDGRIVIRNPDDGP